MGRLTAQGSEKPEGSVFRSHGPELPLCGRRAVCLGRRGFFCSTHCCRELKSTRINGKSGTVPQGNILTSQEEPAGRLRAHPGEVRGLLSSRAPAGPGPVSTAVHLHISQHCSGLLPALWLGTAHTQVWCQGPVPISLSPPPLALSPRGRSL